MGIAGEVFVEERVPISTVAGAGIARRQVSVTLSLWCMWPGTARGPRASRPPAARTDRAVQLQHRRGSPAGVGHVQGPPVRFTVTMCSAITP